MKKIKIIFLTYLFLTFFFSCKKDDINKNNVKILTIASNLQYCEGVAYFDSNLYFTDTKANKIYKWNEKDRLQVFKENSGGANGLSFDKSGNLFICESVNRRIISINKNQNITVLASKFDNIPFNEPNDLWIAPNGNIYFTDPVFSGTITQPSENVYCILASNKKTIKVVDDMIRPNGIVGNWDGTELYIADYGDSKIFKYSILTDGTLNNKQLFAEIKADGLTIDNEQNIYVASKNIMIYNSQGESIDSIQIPGTLSNLLYVENNVSKQLYVTTHTQVFRIKL